MIRRPSWTLAACLLLSSAVAAAGARERETPPEASAPLVSAPAAMTPSAALSPLGQPEATTAAPETAAGPVPLVASAVLAQDGPAASGSVDAARAVAPSAAGAGGEPASASARADFQGAGKMDEAAWSRRFDGSRAAVGEPGGVFSARATRLAARLVAPKGGPVPLVTIGLAAMNGAVFSLTSTMPRDAVRPFMLVADRFHAAFASGSLPSMAHEAMTLLTSGFIHATPEHLRGNMLALLFFGAVAERFWGAGRLLLVYLAGVVVGALAAASLAHNSGSGASGALFAVAATLIAPYLSLLRDWRVLGRVWGPVLVAAGATALLLVVTTLGQWAFVGPLDGAVGVSTHGAAALLGALVGAWWTLRAARSDR